MTWDEWHNLIAKHNLSSRKLRLFAVAAVNEIRHLLTDPRNLNALDTAEAYADNNATKEELLIARRQAWEAYNETATATYAYATYATTHATATYAYATYATTHVTVATTHATVATTHATAGYCTKTTEQRLILVLNSFTHPITDQNLKTSIATQLAHNIYDNKHFHLMPILADALQDAGCDDQILLATLQDTTFPHRRGSNVLDFLTNKA